MFVRDVETGTTIMVPGNPDRPGTRGGMLSADGRHVAYELGADDPAAESGWAWPAVVLDLRTGESWRASSGPRTGRSTAGPSRATAGSRPVTAPLRSDRLRQLEGGTGPGAHDPPRSRGIFSPASIATGSRFSVGGSGQVARSV